jgi:hypothetical protein
MTTAQSPTTIPYAKKSDTVLNSIPIEELRRLAVEYNTLMQSDEVQASLAYQNFLRRYFLPNALAEGRSGNAYGVTQVACDAATQYYNKRGKLFQDPDSPEANYRRALLYNTYILPKARGRNVEGMSDKTRLNRWWNGFGVPNHYKAAESYRVDPRNEELQRMWYAWTNKGWE